MAVPVADRASLTRAPSPALLWALALLGCAAAAAVVLMAHAAERVNEPGLQAALIGWILLPTSSRASSRGGGGRPAASAR